MAIGRREGIMVRFVAIDFMVSESLLRILRADKCMGGTSLTKFHKVTVVDQPLVNDLPWHTTRVLSTTPGSREFYIEAYLVDIIDSDGRVVAENVYDADAKFIITQHNEYFEVLKDD